MTRNQSKNLVVAGFLVVLLIGHLWSLDGIHGNLFGLIGHEDTVYAPGYTDAGFRRIKTGMTEQEVFGIIGKPLKEYRPDMTESMRVLLYSESPRDTDYRIRQINLSYGKVSRKHTEYYMD